MRLFLKNLVFTILVPGSVAGWIPWRWIIPRDFHRPAVWGAAQLLALLPLGLGLAVYLWCVWDFAVTGRGTPAPIDAPRVLVVRGLYRSVRNPMYIGVLLVLLGESLLFRSTTLLTYTAVVALLFHLVVLVIEEPSLRRLFGDSYLAYCRRVRRWAPRLPVEPATEPPSGGR